MKLKIHKFLILVTFIVFVSYVSCQDDPQTTEQATTTAEETGGPKDGEPTKKPTAGGNKGGDKGGTWKAALTKCLQENHIDNIEEYRRLERRNDGRVRCIAYCTAQKMGVLDKKGHIILEEMLKKAGKFKMETMDCVTQVEKIPNIETCEKFNVLKKCIKQKVMESKHKQPNINNNLEDETKAAEKEEPQEEEPKAETVE